MVCTAAMLTAVLPACSNEDEEGGGVASYGKNAASTPPVANAGIEFPVTSINMYNTRYMAFAYQNGRMTRALEYNDDYTFTSDPLTITVSDISTSYSGTGSTVYNNIKVNSDGFITSCNMVYTEEYDDELWTENYSMTCAYDADGHMILEKYNCTDSDGYWENGTTTYNWENGNLMSLEWTSVAEDDEEDEEWRYTEEYTYDEDAERYPNTGVWHFFGSTSSGAGFSFDEPLLYAGLLGKPTRNIPLTCVETQVYENSVSSYRVTGVNYNNDGSIARIYSQYGNNSYSTTTISYGYDEVWDNDWNAASYNRSLKAATENSNAQPYRGNSPRKKLLKRLAQRSETNINDTQK